MSKCSHESGTFLIQGSWAFLNVTFMKEASKQLQWCVECGAVELNGRWFRPNRTRAMESP